MSQIGSLREAVKLSPNNIPLLALFAQALVENCSYSEARKTFEAIVRLDPDNLAAKRGIARATYLGGNLSEAVVRLEALVGQFPEDAESWLLLSRIHLSDGSPEQAIDCYEKAIHLPAAIRDAKLEKELYGEARIDSGSEEKARVPVSSDGMVLDELGRKKGDGWEENLETPKISFRDIGGMDSCKEEIRMKIVYPLQNPDLFKTYGKKIGGGVLLYGPPGCGKTLLSRATAGEIEAGFLSIGIHQILDLYLGNSEKNLHELFELARSHAPCVLFFDEVDALAADRNDMRKSAGRTLINQFLAEMDGNVGNNDGVLILGATNAPWHIDPAFRRPGRFDRVLFVPPPDEAAREAVIAIMAKDKPVADLDTRMLARKAKDFSGADIKSIFDQAAEHCLALAMKEKRVVPITNDILVKIIKSTKPSTRAWFESAKNYAIYSNQSGFYNDVLTFLGLTNNGH